MSGAALTYAVFESTMLLKYSAMAIREVHGAVGVERELKQLDPVGRDG